MNLKDTKTFHSLFQHYMSFQNTGNPKEFAAKLGVSRATLYRFIADLRDEGTDIRFSRSQNCFYSTQTTINELAKQAISQASEVQNLLSCVLPPPINMLYNI